MRRFGKRVPRSSISIGYGHTHSSGFRYPHADLVAEDRTELEVALRKLPLPYSLALRLPDAGVAREVICEYVGVEEDSLDGFFASPKRS
ncbi:hypothetical protein MYBA111488_06450 [Mycobacterium basiliense]